MRRLLLSIAAMLAAAGTAFAQDATEAGVKVSYHGFHSKAMRGTLHYSVSLPSGYATSGRRYPVVYFLHGLPATSQAYRGIAWLAQALRKDGRQAIVVGAQGVRGNDTDGEWLNWGAGRNWETSVAHELVAQIDGRYRTIASRRGRVLVGLSAGGYGAALIGNHNPDVFSVFQSWSGYFEPTTPDGSQTLDLGSKKKNRYANLHRLVPSTRHRFGPYYRSTYFSFYVGTDDGRFLYDNQRLAREMHDYRIPHRFYRVYSGGHNMKLWQREAPAWLGRALQQAASPR
jgi:enterochelin esterase-like enzyme